MLTRRTTESNDGIALMTQLYPEIGWISVYIILVITLDEQVDGSFMC